MSYTAKDITVLEGLEPVRKRPGMYIGGVGSAGLHHLVWEIVDNAVDEAMNGHASEIIVTLHKDGKSVTVSDNGRGVPIDKHPTHKKTAIEIIYSTLHAGGKFEGQNYKTAGGLHGVGASVVNALSTKLVATVKREGAEWQMEFKRGKATGPLKKLGAARGTGTRVYFEPDPTIFPKIDFNAGTIRERLEIASYLHRGVKIQFVNEAEGKTELFHHEQGLADYLATIVAERKATSVHTQAFYFDKDAAELRLEAAVQWTESTDEHLRSYANGIPTASGGTHENGFRAAVGKALRNYIDTHKLWPRGLALSAEDIREGMVGVLSIFIAEPQFQGQTKDRLNNPELQSLVDSAVRPSLEQWLNSNPSVSEQIVGRLVLAARAREASRAAASAVIRKTATSGRLTLPGKLSDCSSSGGDTELFLVEGDSAGGSAKQGRDRNLQAILPLRGKVLNTEALPLGKVLENRELADLVTALGCGIGKTFDMTKLRYSKVVLLADADSDGNHITTLLLTFFYRHMLELMKAGRVYVAVPPLYRIDIGKEVFWAADDADREKILAGKKENAKVEITRFKGLGEMMPATLWETTLNPATRRLLKVGIEDGLETDRVISDLMGKDPACRFRFIMERAEEAQELDV
jgi:DNA gyrase subunit B